jgi:acetate---CoA ligase (ADP-forming)
MTATPIDITRLVRPRSIAIVGVSPEPGSPGGGVLDNLERAAYAGALHLVSRSRSEVRGRPCAGSIDDLPEGIDLAVLTVPRAAIVEAVAACARRRVGAAIIFAAGFAEAGGEWKAAQNRIAAVAREAGIALCGPNCLGLVNYVDRIPLTFSAQPNVPSPASPGIGIVAQSGGLSSILRAALIARAVPVAYAISTGNEAVLGLADYLDFVLGEAMTRTVTVFAEQIREPARFLAAAARAREAGKAIVMLHPGRSAAARAAALSHTGALAPDHAVMEALARHQGVVIADGLDETIDISELLVRFPHVPTAGPAVVTDSGAFCGITLDLCDAVGLDLPPLAPETANRIKAELPDFMTPGNPVDLTAQGILDLDLYTRTIRPALNDDHFGSLFVAPIASASSSFATAKIGAILKAVAGSAKPVVIGLLGDEVGLPAPAIDAVRAAGVPLLRSAERGLRALAKVTAHGRTHARARSSPAAIPCATAPVIASDGVLTEYASKAYLAALGVPVPAGGLARDVGEARAIAAHAGYPVALKIQSAALPHKSDAGGVILDIGDDAALAQAWSRLHDNVRRHKADATIDGVLVEAMAKPGLELIVGARRDPDWGPVVAVGLGGIWTEVLSDVIVLPPDLGRDALAGELKRLKAATLLKGMRGAPPRDVESLLDIVTLVGGLIRARPEIAEIEINPLRLFAQGEGALALDALIVTRRA